MKIKTGRLLITDFDASMAGELHRQSMDAVTGRFLPDEVFETPQIAWDAMNQLIGFYGENDLPQVHPILLDGKLIGYVQLVPCQGAWEIGYHLGEAYRGHGYVTEALQAFIPCMAEKYRLSVLWGHVNAENLPSIHVLERLGFQFVSQDNTYRHYCLSIKK